MKKILVFLLTLSILLFTSLKVVKAEEVDDIPTSSTDTTEEIETETNNNLLEENEPSQLEVWFEENLGWLVGIPTGTILAVIADILVLVKKNKKKNEEISETKTQNKNGKEVLNTAKELLNETKNVANDLGKLVLNALDNIEKTDNLVNDRVNELTNKLVTGFETLNNTLELVETRITKLEEVQEMVALHSKELVANGTAEKITKKIRG